MGTANADAMLANWYAPQADAPDLTAVLVGALTAAHAEVAKYVESQRAAGQEPQKNTLAALDELGACGKAFADGTWMWKQWVALTQTNAGAKLRTVVQPVVDAAAAHERHPEFHKDVRRYLTLVFDLAASALATYETAKREAGAQVRISAIVDAGFGEIADGVSA